METEEEKCNKKPPCDPGWNDPPLFSYDSHTTQIKSEKRGNILNKRVAFPLHLNVTSNTGLPSIDPTLPPQPCDLSKLPPPPSIAIVTSNVSNTTVLSDENFTDFNEEEALSIVMDNFTEVLESKSDNDNIKEKADDIRRRLDVIKKMWEDKKFTIIIQQKILQLSEAIKSGDSEKADHLQKCLMVDYASLCSPWMAGIRHILHSS